MLIGRDTVGLDNTRQLGGDDLLGDRVEFEPLATRSDGRQDLVGLGRRQDELHPGWRLFERLEQSIESLLRQLVDFVDDEDLVGTIRGGELALLADLLGVLELTIGSRVDFDDIEAAASLDGQADWVIQGKVGLRATSAIQGFG